MPKSLNKEQAAQLDALNSRVVFSTVVTSKRDQNGEAIVDDKDRTKDTTVRRATLLNKADDQPWLSADGGDDDTAFAAVVGKARSAERPASTSRDLQEQLRAANERAARAEAELVQVRAGVAGGSIAPKPVGATQEKLAEREPSEEERPAISIGDPVTEPRPSPREPLPQGRAAPATPARTEQGDAGGVPPPALQNTGGRTPPAKPRRARTTPARA